MPDRIKQISIAGASGNDTRDIGAEAQYVEVSYDSQGHIITDITAPGVVVDHTGPLTEALGQVTPGVGLEINPSTGLLDVKYGTAAGTAAQGNDSRLSDDRKNPNAVTFSDGTNTETYDGSAAKTVTYSTVGAAPKEHASATAEYGAASKNNFGHVKIGNGINVSGGVISVDTSSDHITLTQAQYDALTPQEKADPDKYYFIDDTSSTGVTTLGDLADVSLSAARQGEIIQYSSTDREYKNGLSINYTAPVACIVGDTSVTFNDSNILTTSSLYLESENASGTACGYISFTVSAGEAVYTIPALTEATNFRLLIINV